MKVGQVCVNMVKPISGEPTQAYHIWFSQFQRVQAVGHLPWVNIGSECFCFLWNVLEASFITVLKSGYYLF